MGARVKAGNTLSGEAKTIEFPSDWSLTEDGDNHVTLANGGSITPVFNVKTGYGAKGDGATNDTAAIASAIAAANAAGGGRVYFPFGTYMVSEIDVSGTAGVWLDLAQATIKLRANVAHPVIHNSMAANGNYGGCSDLKITGGTVDPNGFTTSYGIVGLVYADKLTIDGVTVQHNPANADWAFQLGGRKALVMGCRVLGGSATFQDGIHVIHGTDWRISDNYLESGDDAIALGATFTDPRLQANPESIRRITISNNVVNSQKAYGLSIYVENGATGSNWEVTDVVVQGLVGQAGVLANGGIRITDLNGGGAGTSQIKRVRLRGIALAVGSTSHNDSGDPEGIYLSSVTDVSISDAALQLTDKTAATTGFLGCTVTNSEDVTIDRLTCNALGRRYGMALTSSNRVKVTRCRLRCTSASANGPMFISGVRDLRILDNDFLDIPSGINGILFSANSGKTSRGTIRGNKFAQLSSGGAGIFAPLTTFAWLVIEDNDLVELGTPINPSTIANGSATTISHAAGYTGSDTALTVADGTQFQQFDVIVVGSEAMRCNSVAGNVLNVTRGVLGSTAAAIADGATLTCRRTLIRANRNFLDYIPAYA